MLEIIKKEANGYGIITNSYIIIDKDTKKTMLIDPIGIDNIINTIKDLNGKLEYIILTHLHFDHIKDTNALKKRLGGKVIMHYLDSINVNNPLFNLGSNIDHIDVDIKVNDNDYIKLGNNNFKIIHTPGHTKGSISLLCDKYLFSGDTLFKGTYGRYDLPSGDYNEIINSVNKLLKLPNKVIVYPGHDEITTIENEKKFYL